MCTEAMVHIPSRFVISSSSFEEHFVDLLLCGNFYPFLSGVFLVSLALEDPPNTISLLDDHVPLNVHAIEGKDAPILLGVTRHQDHVRVGNVVSMNLGIVIVIHDPIDIMSAMAGLTSFE